MGQSALAYLRALYEEAAAKLETAGMIDEAAFVHADLLNNVSAAVTLLEVKGDLRLAAELAEGRGLSADMVVRLWWRAGERERAVAAARARGAFASAIPRLAAVDPEAALDLRRVWVENCQSAGDHLGAVGAAWPEPTLRSLVIADLEAGIALGGAQSGALFAHLVAEHPTPRASEQATALLATRDRALLAAREAFIAAFAALECRDPAEDRRLSTAAVRSAYALDHAGAAREQINRLARRADPLFAADLPVLRNSQPPRHAPIDLAASPMPGQVDVHDVVALPGRALLVANGDVGTQLLTLDGRVRARWDVPADRIIIADTSGSALLVRQAGAISELNRLDLVTRRVTPWTVLRVHAIAASFDGGTAFVVDDDGIALLDVLSAKPQVLWRELDREYRVLRLGRTPQRLTALIRVPPVRGASASTMELWSWELPTMTLRIRRRVELDDGIDDVAMLEETAVVLTADEGTDPKLTYFRAYREPIVAACAPDTVIDADGASLAVVRPIDDGRSFVTVDIGDHQAAIHATFPPGSGRIRMREHDGAVTLCDERGRIMAANPATTGVLANFAIVV
jgi:hypothetical protein